jgi:L-threonylcarbamoyladenylate synthase
MANIVDLNNKEKREKFIKAANLGAIFAYPTEAVFGLGCNINNKNSIIKILTIKKRDSSKGLIVISDSIDKIRDLIDSKYHKILDKSNMNTEIPTTWLCPASDKALDLITGSTGKIALRITKHPVAYEICRILNYPIVSTSANLTGKKPLTNAQEVAASFEGDIDSIIEGEVDITKSPSRIIDLLSKKVLREGG